MQGPRQAHLKKLPATLIFMARHLRSFWTDVSAMHRALRRHENRAAVQSIQCWIQWRRRGLPISNQPPVTTPLTPTLWQPTRPGPWQLRRKKRAITAMTKPWRGSWTWVLTTRRGSRRCSGCTAATWTPCWRLSSLAECSRAAAGAFLPRWLSPVAGARASTNADASAVARARTRGSADSSEHTRGHAQPRMSCHRLLASPEGGRRPRCCRFGARLCPGTRGEQATQGDGSSI